MIIIFGIISFFLEEIINLIIPKNSLFIPLFSILSLIIIYINLEKKEKIYAYSIIFGLIYDIAFTQTLFMNTLIFFLISLLLSFYYKYIPYHIFSTIIISIVIIILYRISTYLLFIIFNNIEFNFSDLFRSIYLSFILNIIYIIISYFLFIKLKNRKRKLNNYKFKK